MTGNKTYLNSIAKSNKSSLNIVLNFGEWGRSGSEIVSFFGSLGLNW